MIWMIYFLGVLALLPGYAVSVEERLRSEQRFCPFSVLGNLKRSTKARKFLSYFGIGLLVLASVLYVTTDMTLAFWPAELGDRVKAGIMLLIVWLLLYYGYARESQLRGGCVKAATLTACLTGLGQRTMWRVAGKATLAYVRLALAVAALVLLKSVYQGVS